MANDPEEKQPSSVPPTDTPAVKPPAAGGEPASVAAAAPPRPPAPPPPHKEGPVALDNDLVKRYKEKFGAAILEAWIDRKQAILVVARELLAEIAIYSRDDEKFERVGGFT